MLHFLVASTIVLAAPTATVKNSSPSSDIPERREFPLNTTVSPCQDFHKYVCSNVESSFKLRDDRKKHIFSFSDSAERILVAKKQFMKDLPQKKDLDARTSQVRDVYLSCMDATARAKNEKETVARLREELQKIKTTPELIQYSYSQMQKGLSSLISVYPSANLDDPKKMDFFVSARFMNLPDHKYYEDPKLLKDYQDYLVVFFQGLDAKLKKAEALKKAQAVLDLEKQFVKIYPVRSERRDRWSQRRVETQAQALQKYPLLQLKTIFEKIPSETLVRIPVPEAVEFLNNNLEKIPLQVWKDIYLFSALTEHLDDGYPKIFKAGFDFEKKYFGGQQTRSDRQERCTKVAEELFVKEIDAALIDQLFPNFDQSKMNEVGSRIRKSIIEGLEANTWLTKGAKKEAIAKIKTARLQLVKPQNDREWDFHPLKTYSPTNYIDNMITYNEANYEKILKEVKEPNNQDAWGMGPLVVNAYYSSSDNKFVMPMGILQFPFYDKDGSVIENLGAVGAVIGHELGHGIDDNGSKFDSKGRLREWMTEKDLKEFSTRSQKMVNQFSNADHDGKLTLGENVADLVGLTFAYNAAFPKGEGSVEDKKRFFVAYGRVWCGVVRPDYAKVLKKTDPHASGVARINEQVKHQKAFAETFQCQAGDPMTLPDSEKIQIW